MSWLRCTISSTRTGRQASPGKGRRWRRSSANIGGRARARCSTLRLASARLLARGFRVTGSDLSHAAVNRAQREAAARRLPLSGVVADFRALPLRAASIDVVIVCDNALPHLETPGAIETALGECFRCARPGGGCLLSMRDYGPLPPPGTVEVRPYGERAWAGRRYHLRQVWKWRGPRYDYSFEITPVDGVDDYATILKSSYLAIPVAQVAELMSAVGFRSVRRVDDRFFQPVLVGTRPAV
jgi:SAM-dependent methyltransferase